MKIEMTVDELLSTDDLAALFSEEEQGLLVDEDFRNYWKKHKKIYNKLHPGSVYKILAKHSGSDYIFEEHPETKIDSSEDAPWIRQYYVGSE